MHGKKLDKVAANEEVPFNNQRKVIYNANLIFVSEFSIDPLRHHEYSPSKILFVQAPQIDQNEFC